MDEHRWLARCSEEQRPHLAALAYRMLGSRTGVDHSRHVRESAAGTMPTSHLQAGTSGTAGTRGPMAGLEVVVALRALVWPASTTWLWVTFLLIATGLCGSSNLERCGRMHYRITAPLSPGCCLHRDRPAQSGTAHRECLAPGRRPGNRPPLACGRVGRGPDSRVVSRDRSAVLSMRTATSFPIEPRVPRVRHDSLWHDGQGAIRELPGSPIRMEGDVPRWRLN